MPNMAKPRFFVKTSVSLCFNMPKPRFFVKTSVRRGSAVTLQNREAARAWVRFGRFFSGFGRFFFHFGRKLRIEANMQLRLSFEGVLHALAFDSQCARTCLAVPWAGCAEADVCVMVFLRRCVSTFFPPQTLSKLFFKPKAPMSLFPLSPHPEP